MALWYGLVDENESVASIVKNCVSTLYLPGVNSNASSNNFKVQEEMVYWAIANASHQSFTGETGGVDFLISLVNNVQCPSDNSPNPHMAALKEQSIPEKLNLFLRKLTVPFLIPDEPDSNLKSSFAEILKLGHCFRCPNNMGIDIGFDAIIDDHPIHCLVECKYDDNIDEKNFVIKYINKAKEMMSPLTFFVSFDLANDFQIDLTSKGLRNKSRRIENQSSKTPKTFNINVYSINYDSNVKDLALKTIFESEQDPDGVFIVVGTNFDMK